MEFLADEVNEIIIDQQRCPNAAREFTGYELDQIRMVTLKAVTQTEIIIPSMRSAMRWRM